MTLAPRFSATSKSLFVNLLLACLCSSWALADPVEVTLLHTNDLHSHFREERTALGLGGIGRLATAVRGIREANPNTLLIDGGDWSEGNIYYTEGTGRAAIELMDQVGYDIALVGNHDWLNGPDVLLNSIQQANPKMNMVGANLSLKNYPRAEEFRKNVLPYVVREVGGVKIAFIGLVTYEFIYDHFMAPVRVTEPFQVANELARRLKNEVDAIVLVSHNSVKMNQTILRSVPDADLVIGAHDHLALTEAVYVKRAGRPDAPVVEAGSWGRFLGQLTLRVTPRNETDSKRGTIEVLDYHLNQIDSRYTPDENIVSRVDALESQIEKKYGNIFHDHLADNEMELLREGLESPIGDFVTDAYRAATGADIAIDQNRFIYGELHPGVIRTVDVFNTLPGVYSAETGKTWTLKILPMKGRTLLWILNVLYSYGKITQLGSISASGLELVFNPSLFKDAEEPIRSRNPFEALSSPSAGLSAGYIRSATVHGEPLDPEKLYTVAAGGGIIEAMMFLNSVIPNAVSLEGLWDTGEETWRILADYIRSMSRIAPDKLKIGGRIRSLQPDLSVEHESVHWTPLRTIEGGTIARIQVKVTNVGATASPAGKPTLHLSQNVHGSDYGLTPIFEEIAGAQVIPSLAPGSSMTFVWDQIFLPTHRALHNIVVRIEGTQGEFNHSNDQVIRWFVPEHTPAASWLNPSIDLIREF